VSGGIVCVTPLLGAERWPFTSTVTTVYVVVRPGQSLESESVVCGGSTRRQPSPFLTTQYHQLDEPPFAASSSMCAERVTRSYEHQAEPDFARAQDPSESGAITPGGGASRTCACG
jgi:hypothetical protein